jgi:hypothetical protein
MIRSFDPARIPRDEIVSLDRAADGADVGRRRVSAEVSHQSCLLRLLGAPD